MPKIIKSEDLTTEYILAEIKKIKYTYGLNKVIRYNLKRNEKFQTQSVAEHLTNMMYLAYYFRSLEDPENKLDWDKVIKIILMHDLGEIETGDIITVAKTFLDENKEREAIQKVKEQSPDFVATQIYQLLLHITLLWFLDFQIPHIIFQFE